MDDISFLNPTFTEAQITGLQDFLDTSVFERGFRIDELLLNNNLDGHFDIIKDTTINVTFLTEGACFENSLGVFTWKTGDFPPPSEWDATTRAQV